MASATMTGGIFSPHPISDDSCEDWVAEKVLTGTTILAVEFNGGVVIAADSRTTSGAYIGNRVTDKLTKVTDYIYALRSGSSADTQAISDIVAYHLSFHRMELESEPEVSLAAAVFRNLCYNYRSSLLAGMIVAGWDEVNGGQVYQVPIGGLLIRAPIAIGGSGSTYIYGYADAHFKPNMSKNDCFKFAANALSLAMNRDGSSGGIIRLASITKAGIERHTIMGDDIPQFYQD